MNGHAQLLDDIAFRTAPLRFEHDLLNAAPAAQVQIDVRGTQRQLKLMSPWFARSVTPTIANHGWTPLCSAWRRLGVSLFCSARELSDVPAAAVPVRFAKRELGVSFDPSEYKTADAIEINCRSLTDQLWKWPGEIVDANQLKTFVETLRQAVGATTPIGLSLPLGAAPEDLDRCDEVNIDFLTLVADDQVHEIDALTLHTLSAAKTRALARPDNAFRILLVAPITDATTAIKLVALGADAICIDSLIVDIVRREGFKQPLAGGGMLAGIASSTQVPFDVSEINKVLRDLNTQLLRRMQQAHVTELKNFGTGCLQGLTEQMCRLSNVRSVST